MKPSAAADGIDTPHATILYHYFHPDDVVSARHLTDLAVGLHQRGWHVTAYPCNRGCRDESRSYPLVDSIQGVRIHRVWRPAFAQASNRGRLLNAIWMLTAWSLLAVFGRRHRREVVIVGTDPVLSVLVALPWRIFRRRCRIAHWCFDLYPEAPIADGMLRADSVLVRILRQFLSAAYKCCDLLADLGSCMARRLREYGSTAKTATLTPWALVEPESPSEPDRVTRRELFGSARIGLLYSGNFGRAHSYSEFLTLARLLRGESIAFCFAGRGNRMDELRNTIQVEDSNITFAGFAPESELEKRLGACDLHLVSLRPEWTGTVVPSKFFGALAAGRGVLFAGSPESAIANWVEEHEVGWVLTDKNVLEVADELRRMEASPVTIRELQGRCHSTYRAHYSKTHQIDCWDTALRALFENENYRARRSAQRFVK